MMIHSVIAVMITTISSSINKAAKQCQCAIIVDRSLTKRKRSPKSAPVPQDRVRACLCLANVRARLPASLPTSLHGRRGRCHRLQFDW